MQHYLNEDNFSFKKLFVPLTTFKVIHIIVIVGFIVFGNMLFNGFVADDFPYIINNSTITSSFNIFDLLGNNIFNSYGFYRPVSAVYFGVSYHMFGTITFFYHAMSLILHILNSILVYLLLRKFININIAFFAAIIFLIHPMNVESVTYISSAGNLLFLLFGMSALNISKNENVGTKRTLLVFVLLLLSMLSKEVGIIFVILVLIIKFLYSRKNTLLFFFYSLIITSLYFIFRFTTIGFQENNYFFIPIQQLTLMERLISIPKIIYFYISTFLFPINLAHSQHWVVKNVDFINFYSYLLFDLGFFAIIFALGYIVYKRDKSKISIYSFFILWFLIGLGTVLQIVPLDMTVAERWMYFPMVGLIGVISITISVLIKKNIAVKNFIVVIIILLIVAFSLRTIIRNTNWYDYTTLNFHDINVVDDYSKEANLGQLLINNGEFNRALNYNLRSVDMNPFYGNIGLVGSNYIFLGDTKKAKEYFSKLSSIPHDNYNIQALYETSAWFLIINHREKAKDFILWALKDYPNSSNLWAHLAFVEYLAQNREDALSAIKKAKSIQRTSDIDRLYSIISNKEPLNLPEIQKIK